MSTTEQETQPPAVLRRIAAAAFCGVSVATLNRLAVDGGGPEMIELSPGCVGYTVDALRAWISSRPRRRSTSQRAVAGAAA